VKGIALRRVAQLQRGSGFPHERQGLTTGDLPFYKVGDLGADGNDRYLHSCTNWVSEQTARELGAIAVPAGAILLPKIGAALLGNARRMTTRRAVFDNNVLAVVPRRIDSRYLYYWLSTVDLAELANPGPVPSLADSALLDLPIPPVDRVGQQVIADFLDGETARIDALIASRRRLAALLNERLESSVYSAVTRGLRNERLEASGLSWVDAIPAGWGTPTVSANHTIQLGKMLSADASAGPEQYPYLRNLNVQWDKLVLDDLATMDFSAVDRRKFALQNGDLLVCEGGEVGRAAVWHGELDDCFFQKAIHRVRPRRQGNSRFLMYCLRAAAKQNVFSIEGNLSTIVHLTAEQLSAHRLPWPSVEEQAEIVRHLDSMASHTHSIRTALERQIALLRERKQSLITGAVTGHLGIPGVVAA
jgi:type I restriction enzyme S subunit